MSCNIEKTLIHPIDKTAYKETIHQDFVSREEFINRTGIFVSPEYFEYIYDIEFKESGVSAEEFVQDYEEKFSTCVQEIALHGTFKYEVMDEDVNCVGEYDECYEPNIWEIVNTLARNSRAEFDKRYNLIEQYNGMIDKVQKIPDKMLALTKFIRQLCLQNDIINGLLECLANNEVCATEIVENDVLKDIWNISMNQLKMILQDVSKNTELLRQFMQVEQEKEQ
jgi:hypothetical protein